MPQLTEIYYWLGSNTDERVSFVLSTEVVHNCNRLVQSDIAILNIGYAKVEAHIAYILWCFALFDKVERNIEKVEQVDEWLAGASDIEIM